MIKQLRKRHLQIWTAWAVLLPAGIITAYSSIKKTVTSQLLQPVSVKPLPIEIKKSEKENYTIVLRSNENKSELQLEWVNKNILTVPTATIYAIQNGDDISKGKLIGRIEARGTYHFAVDSSFLLKDKRLVLFDFIHKQIIDTINL